MSGTSPNFADWRRFATLKVWEIAALMQGFDPRALTDVTDGEGNALDLSDEQRMLTCAIAAGKMTALPPAPAILNSSTEIIVAELVVWLKSNDWGELAAALSTTADKFAPGDIWQEPVFAPGEQNLQKGKNSRAAVEAWVEKQARDLFQVGDTTKVLAERIHLLAAKYDYQSERKPLDVGNITKMIPAGITGGRGRNRRR
jgi:hypothetical protein